MKKIKLQSIILVLATSLLLMACPAPADSSTGSSTGSWSALAQIYTAGVDEKLDLLYSYPDMYLSYKDSANNFKVEKFNNNTWSSLGIAVTTSSNVELVGGGQFLTLNAVYATDDNSPAIKIYGESAWGTEITPDGTTINTWLEMKSDTNSSGTHILFLDENTQKPALVEYDSDSDSLFPYIIQSSDSIFTATYNEIVDLEMGSCTYGLVLRDIQSGTVNPTSIDIIKCDGMDATLDENVIKTGDLPKDDYGYLDSDLIDATIGDSSTLYIAMYNSTTFKIDIYSYDGTTLEKVKEGITPDTNNTVRSLKFIESDSDFYLIMRMSDAKVYAYKYDSTGISLLGGGAIATDTTGEVAIAINNGTPYVAINKSGTVSIYKYTE